MVDLAGGPFTTMEFLTFISEPIYPTSVKQCEITRLCISTDEPIDFSGIHACQPGAALLAGGDVLLKKQQDNDRRTTTRIDRWGKEPSFCDTDKFRRGVIAATATSSCTLAICPI